MIEAKLHYSSPNYQVIEPVALKVLQDTFNKTEKEEDFIVLQLALQDHYVRCAVTNEPIRLVDLRYWDINHQLAFKDVHTSWQWVKEHLGDYGYARKT